MSRATDLELEAWSLNGLCEVLDEIACFQHSNYAQTHSERETVLTLREIASTALESIEPKTLARHVEAQIVLADIATCGEDRPAGTVIITDDGRGNDTPMFYDWREQIVAASQNAEAALSNLEPILEEMERTIDNRPVYIICPIGEIER